MRKNSGIDDKCCKVLWVAQRLYRYHKTVCLWAGIRLFQCNDDCKTALALAHKHRKECRKQGRPENENEKREGEEMINKRERERKETNRREKQQICFRANERGCSGEISSRDLVSQQFLVFTLLATTRQHREEVLIEMRDTWQRSTATVHKKQNHMI